MFETLTQSKRLVLRPQLPLLILLLLVCPEPSSQLSCPPGFNQTLDRCVLFNTSATVNWCDANRECAKLGSELLTNWDILVALSVKQFIPGVSVWVGVCDTADERGDNKTGWQLVNGRGILPTNETVWTPGDPNNAGGGIQDCGMKSYSDANGRDGLMDRTCTDTFGFACEIHSDSPKPSCGSSSSGVGKAGRTRWQPVVRANSPPFQNAANHYCYWETDGVSSVRDCAVLAGMRLFSRSFLYNSGLQRCRVLEFTDSQTELEQLPTNWVKYSRV